MTMLVPTKTKQSAISIVVTRANGSVEDLGIVSYTARSPWKRLRYACKRLLGKHIDETEFFGTKGN
jgi:hypothetical protein